MSAAQAAALIILFVALAAAVSAVVGGWLVARGMAEGRALARRMARTPQAEPEETVPEAPAVEDNRHPFARLLDAQAPWLQRWLASAGSPFTAVQAALGGLVLTAVLLAVFLVLRLPPILAVPAAVWSGIGGPLLLISFLAKRRRQLFLNQMPQTIDLIARSLQAGHPVTTAMAVAAKQMPDPIGPEFGKALGEINYGGERDSALRAMLQRFPLPQLQMFAASLEVTRETGGNVAEVLLKLGDTMRSEAQLRRKVEAISAEGKMSFWVISALPILVVAALLALNPRFYTEVMGDPLFWPMMSGPPLLLVAGAAIIWRMIHIKV